MSSSNNHVSENERNFWKQYGVDVHAAPTQSEVESSASERAAQTEVAVSATTNVAEAVSPAAQHTCTATVVQASDLLGKMQQPTCTLKRCWLNQGDRRLVRAIGAALVSVPVHFGVHDSASRNGKRVLRCNGKPCAMCLARYAPTDRLLVVLYIVEERRLGVFEFDRNGGPGSLVPQLIPLLARADATQLVLDIERVGYDRYSVNVALDLSKEPSSGDQYGDVELRDAVGRGDVTTEKIVATLDGLDNHAILRSLPTVALRAKQHNPGLDVSKL